MKTRTFWKWAKRLAQSGLATGLAFAILYHAWLSPVEIEKRRVERETVVARTFGTGTLEARVQTSVSAEIQGRIVSLHADEGDVVNQGELLVQLDDDEPAEQLKVAAAELRMAQAANKRILADLDRARANLQQADRHYERIRKLHGQEVVSESELDEAKEQFLVAQANFQHEQAALTESVRQIEHAERELDRRWAILEMTLIHSPFDGLVIAREREPGDMAVPGGTIFQLVDPEVIWVSAWVDETEMDKLKPGQRAEVVFRSQPEWSCPGYVERLGYRVDVETREFLVDVVVEKLPSHWAIGQRAEVYIETERREGVTALPREWIFWRQGEAGVYIESGNRARWQPVALGLEGTENVQITEGLAEGETVLRAKNPQQRVEDLDGRRLAS